MKILLIVCYFFVLNDCSGYPDNIKPVENFELNRLLRAWYEITRLDHSFERGLEQVSANYSMHEDRGVKVLNKGFGTNKQTCSEATDKAYFVQNARDFNAT